MFHHDFRIRITSVGLIGVLLFTSALARPTAGVAARAAERFALDAHEGPTPIEFLLAPATVVPAVVPYANLFIPHVRAMAVAGVDATRDATTRTGDKVVARPDLPSAICTVISTADSGAGTLRQCLLSASVNDTITFDPATFPPAAPVAIALASPLPLITLNGLMIDAINAGVILNGSGLLLAGSGLVVSGANGITIRGLRIQNFPTDGIQVTDGARNTVIGGETSAARNVIGGNGRAGVALIGPGTNDNRVLGNYIGVNAVGDTAQGNTYGVVIVDGAQANIVGGAAAGAGNLISGNREFGVLLQGPFLSPIPTSGNRVLGNMIGLNAVGTARVGNNVGVGLVLGAKSNIIGGEAAGAGNLISGNEAAGVLLQDVPILPLGTTGNQVMGNRIGPDVTGGGAISNTIGVAIIFGAQDNVIGGEAAPARNVISGNSIGVQIQGAGTNGNQIKGNFIGPNVTGTARLDNRFGVAVIGEAQDNVIGGTVPGARNVISGNADAGIVLLDPGTTGNQVLGNFIGADLTGASPLTNAVGIAIVAGATKNIVGGTAEGARNVISGNSFSGIQISGDATAENQVRGNRIGVNATGAAALANKVGVLIAQGADNNQIGGAAAGAGNLISGNVTAGVVIQDNGTSGNKVLGNAIGVNAAGVAPLPNLRGVAVAFGATGNDVGGEQPGASNVIAGNVEAGVQFQGSGTSNNKVLSNTIGTDAAGALQLGNDYGVAILGQASSNAVEERNLIKHNLQHGVVIVDDQTTGNHIRGNEIVSNTLYGVFLRDGARSNTVGVSNTIAYNGSYGVAISGTTTLNNTITRNSIHHNAPPQIKFVGAPVPISDAGTCYADLVKSVSCPNCRVEFFAYPGAEIGSTAFMQGTAAAAGRLPSLSTLRPDGMCFVFATVTLADGTTSEFYPVLCPAAYTSSLYKDYAPPKPTPVART